MSDEKGKVTEKDMERAKRKKSKYWELSEKNREKAQEGINADPEWFKKLKKFVSSK